MFVKFRIVVLLSLLFFSTNFAIGQGGVSCGNMSIEDCKKKALEQMLQRQPLGLKVNLASQVKDGESVFRAVGGDSASQTAIESSSLEKKFLELTGQLAHKCSEESSLSSIHFHSNGNVEKILCEGSNTSSPEFSSSASSPEFSSNASSTTPSQISNSIDLTKMFEFIQDTLDNQLPDLSPETM